MGTVRYIGSKVRVVKEILNLVGSPRQTDGAFVDVFAGTGVVSREAALRGWDVRANDHLVSSAITTGAGLLAASQVRFEAFDGYRAALATLQASPPVSGFIFREYSPSDDSRSGHERRYFTPDNARKIDGIRHQIATWKRAALLSEWEEKLLLADLLAASNSVANIAGTYGCFLNAWSPTSLRPLHLKCRVLLPHRCDFQVTTDDAFRVTSASQDVVYLDPPYTKRQYAAYYHVLETIVIGDEPVVDGVTGLRPWQEKASLFCYKTQALEALSVLIAQMQAQRIFLSYSSEGHIALEALEAKLVSQFAVKVHSLGEIGRYRPNPGARQGAAQVSEVLIEIAKKHRAAFLTDRTPTKRVAKTVAA